MHHLSRFVVPVALLALSATACDKVHPTGMSREPLARTAEPAAPASAAAPAATPTAAAPSEAPTKPASTKLEEPKSTSRDTAKPSEEPKPVQSAVTAGIQVKRLVVTRAIANHEPTDTAAFTAGDEPVFAFVELSNPSDSTSEVFITFERDGGKTVGHVRLEVPAKNKRWRTWGKTRFIREAGSWNAVVRAKDGTELARKSFDVS